jgi:ribosomal protein L33
MNRKQEKPTRRYQVEVCKRKVSVTIFRETTRKITKGRRAGEMCAAWECDRGILVWGYIPGFPSLKEAIDEAGKAFAWHGYLELKKSEGNVINYFSWRREAIELMALLRFEKKCRAHGLIP